MRWYLQKIPDMSFGRTVVLLLRSLSLKVVDFSRFDSFSLRTRNSLWFFSQLLRYQFSFIPHYQSVHFYNIVLLDVRSRFNHNWFHFHIGDSGKELERNKNKLWLLCLAHSFFRSEYKADKWLFFFTLSFLISMHTVERVGRYRDWNRASRNSGEGSVLKAYMIWPIYL